jgi:hypothetical protein
MNHKYIARSTEIAARMLAGEMIVMSAADSSLFTLNEQATAIWEAADGVTPLRDLVNRAVCEVFDVDPEVAYRDAETFVTELASHGVLLLSDSPIVPPEQPA